MIIPQCSDFSVNGKVSISGLVACAEAIAEKTPKQ